MKKRLLIIAYQFPPVGGAGVQRVAKLTKFLPLHDWDVSVLTARNHSVPRTDASLVSDVPAATLIRHAHSLEPSYHWKQAVKPTPAACMSGGVVGGTFRKLIHQGSRNILQPDPQVLWVPDAIRQGLRLMRERKHDAIMVSGPPFSSFVVGAVLRRHCQIPLLLDYRDEWGLSNRYWENRDDTRWTRLVQHRLERWVMGHASGLTATTQASAASLRSSVADFRLDVPVDCVYNGFDRDDFREVPDQEVPEQVACSGRLRLSHVGTLWRLTSARPLVDAVEHLARTRPEACRRLDVELVGRCTSEETPIVDRLRHLPCRFIYRDYVDHTEAVETMHRSDQLCLFLANVQGCERVVPAKTFEYLASRRRILAMVPDGETRNLLSVHPGVNAFEPNQIAKIADHLAQSIENKESSHRQSFDRDLDAFDRYEQAGRMAKILDGLTTSRQRSFIARPAVSIPLSS